MPWLRPLLLDNDLAVSWTATPAIVSLSTLIDQLAWLRQSHPEGTPSHDLTAALPFPFDAVLTTIIEWIVLNFNLQYPIELPQSLPSLLIGQALDKLTLTQVLDSFVILQRLDDEQE